MDKRKIIISTWYRPGNYGTALQALALKHYLENEKYNVYFLQDNRNIDAKYNKKGKLDKISKKIKRIFDKWFWKKLPYKYALKNKENMQNLYIERHIKTITINSMEEIKKVNQLFEVFISGGDQIWNPYVTSPGFMLDFVPKNKLKISYGTSVGVKTIPMIYIEMYKKYLSEYRAISVREKQSSEALRTIVNNNVDVVLDPTLLFSGEEWNFLLQEAQIDVNYFTQPYILVYLVGARKNYWNYVEKIKNETGYRVVVVPINDEAYFNNFKKYVEVSPAEFLWLIKNAAIICTDSFHATVFSVLFCKEFYTVKRFSDFNNESQNGRLVNFLSKYGLIDRLIEDESFFKRVSNIDYEPILKCIERERNLSKQWLKNALNK